MPTTAATQALLRSLRSKRTISACRQNAVASRQTCIASSICPARTLSTTTSTPPIHKLSTQAQQLKPIRSRVTAEIGRRYGSSIQGTIGAGDAGIEQEAAHPADTVIAPQHLNEKEKEIWEMLQRELKPVKLEVQDVSGGCGSMYAIEVASDRFRGLSMLKQQRLVNEVLGEEIRGWHGVQLRTSVP